MAGSIFQYILEPWYFTGASRYAAKCRQWIRIPGALTHDWCLGGAMIGAMGHLDVKATGGI